MRFFIIIICVFFALQGTATPKGKSDAITITVNTVNATCQRANGKIIVQATGGIAPYLYQVTSTVITFSLTNNSGIFYRIPASTFVVTATDALGATASQTVTITNTFLRPNATYTNRILPTGCLTRDAGFTVNASGGLAPYTYSLDNRTYQISNVFTGLTAGNYQYIVKDANGCISFQSYITHTVGIRAQCYPFTYSGSGGSAIGCDPYNYAALLSPGSGGTPPYYYSADSVNFQTSRVFPNLTENFKTFWIKDATGLTYAVSHSVADICESAFQVSAQAQNAYCGAGGSITVTAMEGIPPYQYSLDGVNYQASNTFSNLTPKLYTVTVKDSYNQTTSKYVTVNNNCIKVTSTTTNATCGNANGTVTAQVTGGTAPYSFSLGGVSYAANNIISNVLPGTYFLYAKDANGNKDSLAITINNTAGAIITKIDTTATDCDNKSGKIIVTATGGTVPVQYSINGTNWQSSNTFTNLAKGMYTVSVKDGNNCVNSQPTEITMAVQSPVVNLGNDKTLCEGETLLLDATNSSAAYIWQDNSTASTYLVKQSGIYYVTVSRAGCSAKDTVNISYNLKPSFTLGPDQFICGGMTITLNPQLSNVNYLWQDGSINPSFTVVQPGLYYLTAVNTCGSKTDSINIVKGACKLYIPTAFTPNRDGKNDLFKASFGENITEYRLQIFNRYGEIVFASKDKNIGWDGGYKNKVQPSGSYAWIIKYRTSTDNAIQQLKGSVLLIR
jgi:large repetitive protein